MYDLNRKEGAYYITMEYVPGEDLKGLIKKVKLDTGSIISIGKQICEGLSEAHRLDIVHRDLKPSNIMIDKDGIARIMDFGIARSIKEKGITGSGVMIGTPEYMSPEQIEAKDLDQRTDIYSLGVILYEMVTGKVPFEGETPMSIAVNQKDGILKRPEEYNVNIPHELSDLIMRCLEREKENRYSKAEEVKSEFAKIEKGLPSTEKIVPQKKTATSREITLKFDIKKLFIPAFVIILFLIIMGYFILQKGSKIIEIKIGRTQQITYAPGIEIDPTISPDGKMIAYAAGPVSKMHLYIRQISGGRTIALTESFPGNYRWPQWSPDGTSLIFQSDETIYTIPALGGIPKQLVKTPKGETIDTIQVEMNGTPSWSPDGTQLAYAEGKNIFVVSADGLESRKLVESFLPYSLRWSPDGSKIAYVSGNTSFVFGRPIIGNIAPSSIWIVSTVKGDPVQITDNQYLNVSPVWTPDGGNLLYVSNQGGSRDIYQIPLKGSSEPAGPPVRLTTGLDAHTISISADGKKLAYSVFAYSANIWKIRIPKGETISITEAVPVTEGNQAIEGISVSPDGKWLAFDSNRSGNQDIYKMPVEGGELEKLTTHPSDDFLPSWSYDGKDIVFYSFRKGNRDIHTMTAEGGSIQQLTDDPAQERYPDWSPDGNHIVFQSDKTGVNELFIISRENKDSKWESPRQLTFDGGKFPRWSPDGNSIAYSEGKTSKSSLRVIHPEGGDPMILLSSSDPDAVPIPIFPEWSPDSQTVYYKAYDNQGNSSFWSVPVSGGKAKLLVRFNDSLRKSIRHEYATDGTYLFFTITENRSDLWVMDLIIEEK
jgi:Tol biopolymer transport system component